MQVHSVQDEHRSQSTDACMFGASDPTPNAAVIFLSHQGTPAST
jgi:hypothetical protein